jgi:hypothetical protein
MVDRFAAYKSKRFLAILIATILFTVMVYTTKYNPLELSASITALFGMYIALQTVRESPPENKNETIKRNKK